jgi:hypothetical protein
MRRPGRKVTEGLVPVYPELREEPDGRGFLETSDVLEEEMLGEFRRVRDEIELKIKAWLEHPEAELRKLTQQRERMECLFSER